MQQKQTPKQNNQISQFIQFIKSHLDNINKLNEQIYKKLSHSNFPIKQLISFYQRQLLSKLNSRSNKSYIFSDILIWYGHRLIGFVYGMDNYIESLDQKTKKQVIVPNPSSKIQKASTMPAISRNTLMSLASSLGSSTQISHIDNNTDAQSLGNSIQYLNTLEGVLKLPYIFLKKNFVQFLENLQKNAYSDNERQQKQKQELNLFLSTYTNCLKLEDSLTKNKNNQKLTVEQLEQVVKQEFYKKFQFSLPKNLFKFIFRLKFLSKLSIRAKKANKKLNQRKMRILQLIDGQKKYIDGLKDYIQYIKKPIQATKLITEEQSKILFSQIQSILTLHTHLHSQLAQRYQNYNKQQTYGDILGKNFPYFKIYNDYILNANQAQTLLLKLIDEHEQIDNICKKFMEDKQKNASDELKQPTFRIARYQMIIKQILKNTNPIHPDHKKLEQAQLKGIKMLTAINQNVNKTANRTRLNKIEQQYGTQQRPIFTPERQLLQEFQLFHIMEDKQVPVNVVVCNDVVIVINTENKRITKWINIDENFYVRKQEDNKIYKNIIKIHSDGFISFSAGSEQKHLLKAETFFNLLQKVSKQNQQNNRIKYVQVIGTQQIGSTSFAKHTQYIIQIKYLGLRKYVHLRFSQMQPLLNRIQQHYDNNLNISHQEALKKNWFNNHKSKTIEDRKRTIQQILQKILNHQLVKNDPKFVLQQLKIDVNFFSKTEQYKLKKEQQIRSSKKNQQQQLLSNSYTFKNNLMRSRKKQSKEAETILCATQIKLGRDLFHDNDELIHDNKKLQSQKYEIQVHTTLNQQPVSIMITQFHTIQDICHKLSKRIGLRMNRDFRLFHQIGKKQLRVLDQQQKLMKIFQFPQTHGSGIFQSIKKIVSPQTHPKLIFKKYYFLPVQIEQSECRKDLTRLRLIVYQIFSQIKDMKYQISFDEYLLFLAMLIYIEYDGDPPEEIDNNYVYRIIPDTIFKLKNYTEEQWINKSIPHINRLKQEIDKIIQYNREQLQNKRIKTQSISKYALHFDHKQLCSQIVINKIKTNPIFGSNLFYVQPYKDTFEKLGKKMAYNMWLAIKVEGLNLLTPSSKQIVLQLKYKDIEKIFVYSQSIIFRMQGIMTCQYRFNTYQSFQISQLVKYNKCLSETLQQLQKGDEDLIAKARNYKQQSLIYRNIHNSQIE